MRSYVWGRYRIKSQLLYQLSYAPGSAWRFARTTPFQKVLLAAVPRISPEEALRRTNRCRRGAVAKGGPHVQPSRTPRRRGCAKCRRGPRGIAIGAPARAAPARTTLLRDAAKRGNRSPMHPAAESACRIHPGRLASVVRDRPIAGKATSQGTGRNSVTLLRFAALRPIAAVVATAYQKERRQRERPCDIGLDLPHLRGIVRDRLAHRPQVGTGGAGGARHRRRRRGRGRFHGRKRDTAVSGAEGDCARHFLRGVDRHRRRRDVPDRGVVLRRPQWRRPSAPRSSSPAWRRSSSRTEASRDSGRARFSRRRTS
jgi:hypothetical protein